MSEECFWERIVHIDEIGRDVINQFSCGVTKFDSWLRASAHDAEARGECRVHVCLGAGGFPVAFFTLSSTSIQSSGVPKRLSGGMDNSVPATLLGKMGVRTDIQGNGYGTRVLHHAMHIALDAAELVSSRLLVVDALTTDLVPWYENRGFRKLPGSERRLVLKMSKIAEICNSKGEGYFIL